MKKGKWALIVAALFAAEFVFSASINFAQETDDNLAIKQVMEEFVKSLALLDLNSAMKHISADYKEATDYGMFKSRLEKGFSRRAANLADASNSDLSILSLDIHNDKAELEVQFKSSAFDLNSLKNFTRIVKRQAILAKENGVWKITQWSPLNE